MRAVNAAVATMYGRRASWPGAPALALALALPWTLHAQAAAGPPPAGSAPPAAEPSAPAPQPPSEPAERSPTPAPGPAPAAVPDARYVVRPVFFKTPPVIDGRLDDPVWQTAARLDGFRQLEPQEGAPSTERTEVFLGYDRDNLYIGAHCHDSQPGKIITTTLTRDSDVGYDDTLTLLFDTYHDGRTGYLFTTNSGGVQVDALVRNEGEQVNLDWDGIWAVEGRRDETGWTVEIAIPWKTLRFPDKPEQVWGFNVERDIARKHERSFWKPIEHSWYARYKLSQAGTLTGLQGARPGSRFQFAPYAAGGAQRPSNGSTSSVTRLGGDIKVNLASDLVGDVTVKTDFSEAEADEQDVNLTRNALLFPEKRAFFLEGASLFYFGERPDPEHPAETFLFFSRQIGLTPDGRASLPVLGGVKLTGHEGNYDIGVLGIETQATHKPDGYGGIVDAPRTTYSVMRLKRELPNGSAFGVIGLSKDATGDRNHLGGADWDVTLTQNLRSGGYFAKSWTPGINGRDWAGSADVYWDSRNWRFHEQYTEIGQGFNDELGYLARTGIRAYHSDNYWILWPEKGLFKQAWFVYDFDYYADSVTGQMQTRINHAKFSGYFRDSSGIAYKYYDETEVLTLPFQIKHGLFVPPGTYHFGHHFFGFQTDYTKPLGAAGRLAWGDYYDGSFIQSFAYVAYRPVPGLFLASTYQQTKVHLREGSFTNNILLGEITYAFSAHLSTRLWVRYDRTANLREKFDIDWEFRPGSKLFIVYEDIKTYIDFFDPRQPTFGTPGRSLIAKIVYVI